MASRRGTDHSLKFTAGLTDQFLIEPGHQTQSLVDGHTINALQKHVTFITRPLKMYLIQTRCDKAMNYGSPDNKKCLRLTKIHFLIYLNLTRDFDGCLVSISAVLR